MKDRNLGSISNYRIQRFKEKTIQFRFSIQYCPGKWHKGADAVSRYPSATLAFMDSESDNFPILDEDMIETKRSKDSICSIYALHDSIPSTFSQVISLTKLRELGQQDDEYQELKKALLEGFPSTRHTTAPSIRKFWSVRDRLFYQDDIILMDQRIVIPSNLKRLVLLVLHSAHQGCSSMLRRAQTCVYWPNMEKDILNLRASCSSCCINAPSNCKEPIIMATAPTYPYEKIAADYFQKGSHAYLTVVDCFSGWMNIFHFPVSATATSLINICRDIFITYGVPTTLASDGGPQFIAHSFQQFLKNWDVYHKKLSAGYAQSNGRAEAAVKTAKRILSDNIASDGSINNDNVAKAMLQYRNTPLPFLNLSPAQLLFHRELRDFLPRPISAYQLHESWVQQAKQREALFAKRNEKIAERYNKTAHELQPLPVGSKVLVQNKGLQKRQMGQIWKNYGGVI